ncbi:MAG: hypothetical protein HZA18_03645 [Nitrospirae bacterium]|nr:hypothetical protein [Nitrospirota bacterium]
MAGLKIYTDENVDVRIAEGLKKRGIKAFSAIEQGMTGVADTEHFNKGKGDRFIFYVERFWQKCLKEIKSVPFSYKLPNFY